MTTIAVTALGILISLLIIRLRRPTKHLRHEDPSLDPDDPFVRLIRQARAARDGRIRLHLGQPTDCPTCGHHTQRPVFAHSRSVDCEYAIRIATHCPNCPTEGDDE